MSGYLLSLPGQLFTPGAKAGFQFQGDAVHVFEYDKEYKVTRQVGSLYFNLQNGPDSSTWYNLRQFRDMLYPVRFMPPSSFSYNMSLQGANWIPAFGFSLPVSERRDLVDVYVPIPNKFTLFRAGFEVETRYFKSHPEYSNMPTREFTNQLLYSDIRVSLLDDWQLRVEYNVMKDNHPAPLDRWVFVVEAPKHLSDYFDDEYIALVESKIIEHVGYDAYVNYDSADEDEAKEDNYIRNEALLQTRQSSHLHIASLHNYLEKVLAFRIPYDELYQEQFMKRNKEGFIAKCRRTRRTLDELPERRREKHLWVRHD